VEKLKKNKLFGSLFFFHLETMTDVRAVWDMCLSSTLERFLVLCPLSISPSHLLSKDTNLKKLTHYRNPLEFFPSLTCTNCHCLKLKRSENPG